MRPTKQQLLISVMSILAIIGIGAGVAFMLKNVIHRSVVPIVVNASRTPSQVIQTFSLPNRIKSLSSTTYQEQSDATATAYIRYKLDGHNYTISTVTKNQILFFAKNKSQIDDTLNVQSDTTTFMHDEGYEKVQPPTSASTTNDVAYQTYASSDSVCQLTDSPPVADIHAYHTFACVSKSAIETEYSTTEKLLNLYRQSHQLVSFNETTRTSESSENKSLSVIGLTNLQSHPLLLFVAIDNNWTYIGDLSGNGMQQSNGKYVINPDVKQAISDPKYGNFLTKYLQS